jgi:hypothetical protein
MKKRRISQPGLFDLASPSIELTAQRRAETLALLGTLLIEAIALRSEAAAVAKSWEAGDEQDHG